MGIEDPALWAVAASAVAAVVRPIQNIIIFFIAVHGAEPGERSEIIDSLAGTRQFGLWSKPQWPKRRSTPPEIESGPHQVEQIDPQPADDGAT